MTVAEGRGDGPVWGIVVAGGSGVRYGAPKQWEDLDGQSLTAAAVATARQVCDGVVLVVPPIRSGADQGDITRSIPADRIVEGGATRAGSVRNGLSAVPDDVAVIVVHDGVRPRASVDLFAKVVQEVRNGAAGAVPALPVNDTLKLVAPDGSISRTLDRSGVVTVQTPQAFSAEWLRRAHAEGGDATDDAGLVEGEGGRVVVVDGEADNLKVTTPEDLARLKAQAAVRPPALRIGHGFDVHRWSDLARPLVLGGVTISEERGLEGHSDADVVTHALADAVLGAADLGDLGAHFPDGDPRWAGARSTDLLAQVVSLAARGGWAPINADLTVLAEQPRLAPHVADMKATLSRALGAPVSVKATTAERIGGIGRGEGIAAWAVTLLSGA